MNKTYDATIDYTPASVRWPYRRLEYIAQPSSGDQLKFPYVSIGYNDVVGWKWEVQGVTRPDVTNKQDIRYTLLCSDYFSPHQLGYYRDSETSLAFYPRSPGGIVYCYWNSSTIWEDDSGDHELGNGFSIDEDFTGGKHTLEINYGLDGEVRFDGTTIYSNKEVAPLEWVGSDWGVFYYNMYWRGVSDPQTGYPTAPGIYLYGLHVQTSNGVRTGFIPAQRKSDGMVGLYDTTAGVFLPNSNTSGGAYDFVAGPVADECWDLTDPG